MRGTRWPAGLRAGRFQSVARRPMSSSRAAKKHAQAGRHEGAACNGQASDPDSRVADHADAIWSRLHQYSGSYLRRYFIAADASSPSAADVLAAFNELAYQVTGPGGFWRKQGPHSWLGCKAQPESASCGAIETLAEDLARWDALQEQIVATDEAGA